jgi:hypothetical protein
MKHTLVALMISLPLSLTACMTDNSANYDSVDDGSDVNDGKLDNAAGTVSESDFKAAAAGAKFVSETDSAPTYLSAKVSASAKINKALIRASFGRALQLQSSDAMEFSNKAAALTFIDDAPDADDAKSVAAWKRIKVLTGKLSKLVLIKVGPGIDGKLTTDQGEYKYLVVGKTADSKLVGFFVVSVET